MNTGFSNYLHQCITIVLLVHLTASTGIPSEELFSEMSVNTSWKKVCATTLISMSLCLASIAIQDLCSYSAVAVHCCTAQPTWATLANQCHNQFFRREGRAESQFASDTTSSGAIQVGAVAENWLNQHSPVPPLLPLLPLLPVPPVPYHYMLICDVIIWFGAERHKIYKSHKWYNWQKCKNNHKNYKRQKYLKWLHKCSSHACTSEWLPVTASISCYLLSCLDCHSPSLTSLTLCKVDERHTHLASVNPSSFLLLSLMFVSHRRPYCAHSFRLLSA